MPPPTCKCAVCGKETTKRQTLDIQPYGRICRDHPEVEAYKDKLAESEAKFQSAKFKAETEQKQWEEINDMMSVLSLASLIRVSAFKAGVSAIVSWVFLGCRIPEKLRDKVYEEVKKRGDMTEDEFSSSIMTYAMMQAREGD